VNRIPATGYNPVIHSKKMKKYTFLSLIFGLLAACESPDVCTGNCANKRIRFIDDGVNFNRIIYDDENRQTYFMQAADSLTSYEYNSGTVTSKGGINGNTNFITDDGIVSGMNLVTTADIPSLNLRITYEYDAAGQLIKTIQKRLNNPSIILNVNTSTWVLGNLTTSVSTNTGTAPVTTKYTYYPNINNTVSNEYNGLMMFGKTSNKAIKTVVTGANTTNYVYETNECGCITQTNRTQGSTAIIRKYTYELIPR
jgi:hypothetical protein